MTAGKRLFPMMGIAIILGLIVGLLLSFSQDFQEFFHGAFRHVQAIVIFSGLLWIMSVALVIRNETQLVRLIVQTPAIALSFLLAVLFGGMM
ncbi:hypothetical protein IID21_05245 [Patescibacteria group bacterium]|nr:hypothetical protein [Patescibacteria group bacterium]